MFSKALDRSTSRDRARLRLAGPRSLRSRERRCAPRACGACGVGGRPRRPRPFWVHQDCRFPIERRGRLDRCVRTGPPRSPLPPSASLAVTPFQYVV